MPEELGYLAMNVKATAVRPLLGLTVLVVEDSRFASEALRLLCIRSGARIRRADSLSAAHRHLKVYRPAVVIVDLGLPDGSGIELIEEFPNRSRASDRCFWPAAARMARGWRASPTQRRGCCTITGSSTKSSPSTTCRACLQEDEGGSQRGHFNSSSVRSSGQSAPTG